MDMDGNGRHDVPFLLKRCFGLFSGANLLLVFSRRVGLAGLLLKRVKRRGIDLGLIPFFGMGFKKA